MTSGAQKADVAEQGGLENSNRDLNFVGAPMAQPLRLQEANGHQFGLVRFQSVVPTGMTSEHLNEDALLLSLQLKDYEGSLWVDGRPLPAVHQPAGFVSVHDYRRSWRADLRTGFDCVNYHLPRPALETLVRDRGARRLNDLDFAPGEVRFDPVIAALTSSLLPAMENPHESNALFLDHVGWSIAAHVVARYGLLSEVKVPMLGLAAWQERRAKEMIDACLDGEIKLTAIADECGISVSHLTRAFKRTTGLPPHQWLLHRRVEAAKDLLLDPKVPVVEVAIRCGFADQSHLTRVFSRLVGSPPGAWRRSNVL